MKISIPYEVKFIMNIIESYGYEAYVVGGCVRDLLLNLTPNDWDITTSAKPIEIKKMFNNYNLVDKGEKHGTIGVVLNHSVYEITTYRIDGEYSDSRHPEYVEFTEDIVKDLSRRDFTVNAIAYNENSGFIDPFNGVQDIKDKAIRCVGNPDTRFNEDALRILRALRFASVYGFNIDVNTATALIKNRLLLNNIAVERISSEFNKLLCGDNVGYILRRYKDVFAVFMPELVSTFDCKQNTPHHNKTVWRHTVAAVCNIRNELLLRMVMLMHDIGKPMALKTDKKGVDHFHNHQRYSAELAKNILVRMKYPTDFIQKVITLVLYHDKRAFNNSSELKLFLNEVGIEICELLWEVQFADISAQSNYLKNEKIQIVENNQIMFNDIINNDECFSLKQLNINGSDLLHLGITEGTQIGNILKSLLEEVINGKIENDNMLLKKKALMKYNEIKIQ